jgi:hypothetical protein
MITVLIADDQPLQRMGFRMLLDSSTLSPGAGLAAFAGWAVLLLALAAWRLARADA